MRWLRPLFFILSSCCVCTTPAFSETSERIELYLGIAEGNYLIGDLSGAELTVAQVLRLDADHVPALTLQARILMDQGAGAKALASAEQAIVLEPEVLEHQLLKALILGNLQRQAEALPIIESVIAAAPAESQDARIAHQLLGLLRMAEGDWEAAALAFNEIYLADPAQALTLQSEAYLEKARSDMLAGESDAALDAVDQAIAVYADQTGEASLRQRTALRLMRARLLAQLGRSEAAVQTLQTLTGQQPDNFEALITLASLYASLGRWASLDSIMGPIAARPELQDIALYLEGRAALAKNRVGRARAKFEAAIEQLPPDAERLRRSLYFYQGVCLSRLERQAEAEQSILQAIDAGFIPETSEEALIASRVLLGAQRAKDAIPLLEAITLNRVETEAAVWSMLGRAHAASEAPLLALSAFNESIIADPSSAEVRALRGAQLRKIGDLEGALADYDAALQVAPDNAALLYTRGLIYLQLGQLKAAEPSIAAASQRLPNDHGLQMLHALLAYNIGAYEVAQNSLNRYLQAVPEQGNPSAHYLHYILALRSGAQTVEPIGSVDALIQYFKGTGTHKQVLDHAGTAETAEQARKQICAAAYWMAQYEAATANRESANELLQLALEFGTPENPEYQFAHWQLNRQASE